jgi:hypothetical protein
MEGNGHYNLRPGEPIALITPNLQRLSDCQWGDLACAVVPAAQADCGGDPTMSNESCIDARRLSVD